MMKDLQVQVTSFCHRKDKAPGSPVRAVSPATQSARPAPGEYRKLLKPAALNKLQISLPAFNQSVQQNHI